MFKNLKKSDGAISTILLILAAVLVVLIIIVFVVIKLKVASAPKPAPAKTATTTSTTPQTPPAPVYNTTIGNLTFNFQSAQDLGTDMKSPNTYEPDLTTTGKFIEVTVGAQNTGKVDTTQGIWSLGNIVDSDGRNFIPINSEAYAFLPNPNLCGSILLPAFPPVPCVSFYEVSDVSTGLTVQVIATPTGASKAQTKYLDLKVN